MTPESKLGPLVDAFGAAVENVGMYGVENVYAARSALMAAVGELVPRWRPIAELGAYELALLYAPPGALYADPDGRAGEFRVSCRKNWTWATNGMPLPPPPSGEQQ